MNVIGTIIIILLIVIAFFLVIVGIPILFGKLFLKWSNRRINYIFTNSMTTVLTNVVISLIITGLTLLIGIVFKQQWAFSGGLLLVYILWLTVKAIAIHIKESKNM